MGQEGPITANEEWERHTTEVEAAITEGMAQMEIRTTNLIERAQEELKEAVEAGLAVIQAEVRMPLEDKTQKEKELRTSERARVKRIEKGVVETGTAIKSRAETLTELTKQIEHVRELEGS